MKRLIVNIALLLLVPLCARAQYSLGVDAPGVVSIDERIKLVYTATGKVSDFIPPSIQDFDILAGPSPSTMSNTQIINGKMTHTYEMSYTYILTPRQEGTFTIPPASVVIDKKTYSSKAVTIEVVKTASAVNNSSSSSAGGSTSSVASGNNIILKLSLSKKNVVKGEPIIATLKLYTAVNINGFDDIKFPTFNGFWSQEIESPTNLEFVRENLDGEIYSAALIRKYILLPQQTGVITIEPAEIVCQVPQRNTSTANSIFDSFFDDYQVIKKRVSTPEINVNVAPLPAGAPASFTGGVGDFKIDVKLSKDTVNAHEAASLVMTITGTGNLNLIEAPKIVLPPDFESYDVKRTEKISSGAKGSTGTKSFEYPFIPRSPGHFTIDPIKFSYYDIAKGRYITLTSQPTDIGVGRGSESGAVVLSEGLNKLSVKNIGDDIRFISTDGSRLKKNAPLFVATPWMYVIIALIIALYFAISAICAHTLKRRKDVVGAKTRKAKKVAKVRLKKAESFLKENLYSAFYEELHKAITGYISDKFSLPIADFSRESINEQLSSKGYGEDVIKELFDVLDACEYARYAPSTGYQAMENHYKSALNVISKIES